MNWLEKQKQGPIQSFSTVPHTYLKLDYQTQTPEQVIDYLMFCSYRANRGYGMTPDELRQIFGASVEAMEAKYQREQGNLDELQQRLASAYATLLVSTRGDL